MLLGAIDGEVRRRRVCRAPAGARYDNNALSPKAMHGPIALEPAKTKIAGVLSTDRAVE